MSDFSIKRKIDITQYVLDTSAIIRNPEILSFSSQDTKLVILTPSLAELGMYSDRSGQNELQQLVNRALEAGLVKAIDVGYPSGQNQAKRASKAVDTSIVAYVLDQLSEGIKTVCVSLDKDLLVPLAKRGAAITPDEFLNLHKKNDTAVPAATIGLAEFQHRAKIWLAVNIVASALTAVACILAYKYIDTLLKYVFVFKWTSAFVFTVMMGVFFYWIRQKYRIPYAVTEITIGIIAALTSVNVSGDFPFKIEFDVNTSIKLAGGFYIIVRGLDNLGKGFEGRRAGIYWKRYFG